MCMSRVPTLLLPLGAGTVTVPKVPRALRTGAAFNVSLICAVQRENPVPDKVTCCGLSVLLSVMTRFAARGPRCFAVKITLMLHVLPAATLVPHGLAAVSAKSLTPTTATLLTVRVDPPVFVSTTVWAALGWPRV